LACIASAPPCGVLRCLLPSAYCLLSRGRHTVFLRLDSDQAIGTLFEGVGEFLEVFTGGADVFQSLVQVAPIRAQGIVQVVDHPLRVGEGGLQAQEGVVNLFAVFHHHGVQVVGQLVRLANGAV